MKTIAKISLVCAFAVAGGAAFKYALEDMVVKKAPPVIAGDICTASGLKPAASVLSAPPAAPVTTVPVEVQQPEARNEAAMEMPMMHHHHERLVSTVDVEKAIEMSSLGEIGFADDTATVTVTDEAGSTHDFTFGFEGKGAICDEVSPVCTTMDTISEEQKSRLTDKICERAKGHGGEAFYQEICALKP